MIQVKGEQREKREIKLELIQTLNLVSTIELVKTLSVIVYFLFSSGVLAISHVRWLVWKIGNAFITIG